MVTNTIKSTIKNLRCHSELRTSIRCSCDVWVRGREIHFVAPSSTCMIRFLQSQSKQSQEKESGMSVLGCYPRLWTLLLLSLLAYIVTVSAYNFNTYERKDLICTYHIHKPVQRERRRYTSIYSLMASGCKAPIDISRVPTHARGISVYVGP